jgi:glycyl-tRNA synthetase beta chain
VLEAAAKVKGVAVIDEQLLEEVASMVEWPVAVTGNFDKVFLEIPAEALITTMKNNQKYFHITDKKGKLMPYFITISNIDSKQPEMVKQGNEKVVRPRFVDAEFFWKQDRQTRLADRMKSLNSVVYQQKLGTLFDKVQRVANLSKNMAADMGADVVLVERAALLSKCDLMTDMVGEFPSLQGVMGRYYADHDGEDKDVAVALDEQYKPRFAGDTLPETKIGQIISIADKIDTIVGIFAIKQIPTGDKDPFALRRAALGVLRTAIEKQLDIDLSILLNQAVENYKNKLPAIKQKEITQQCFEFIMERARFYYQESGITADVFDSVLAQMPGQPFDFDQRVKAVTSFRQLPEAESLSAANKRIANILKKTSVDQAEVDESLLTEAAEKSLYEILQKLTIKVTPLFANRDYQKALTNLAELRETSFLRVLW